MSKFLLETYKFAKDPVKLAHIFSNYKYAKGKRRGNEVDVKNLKKILPELGFKVKVHEDWKQTKCLDKLEAIADNDGKEASMILVVFLSHGSLNEIKMTDNKTITIKQVAESFNSKGNSFAGKPKIFLFQMCQGNQSAKPLTVHEEKDETVPFMEDTNETSEITNNQTIKDEIIVEDIKDSTGSVPSGSDMFMGFSSSPGFVSYRSPIYGSRFIQTLITIINNEINLSTGTSQKIDFLSLMTKVAAEVADMSGGSWPRRIAAKARREPIPETKGKA